MPRIFRYWPAVAIAAISTFLVLLAQGTYVPSGAFNAATPMTVARDSASSAVLIDGRILVTGGKDDSGNPLDSAEILGGSSAGQMHAPRAGHIGLTLNDGTVLVAGGSTTGGAATNSTEIYNPATGTWTVAAHAMLEARIGATATRLSDGRVLIAGGDNGSGPLQTTEIYDPATGVFSSGAPLSSARKSHAATLLNDGRVAIAGGIGVGSDGQTPLPLNTIDIYDPVANTATPFAATMSAPRIGLSATTLLKGRVLLAGGGTSSGAASATTDILDVSAGTVAAGPSMSAARTSQLALLLPNNNTVLMVGGASDSPAAEIYVPWQNVFTPFGALAAARTDATGGASGQSGAASIAGGQLSGTASSVVETIHFPMVKTDKPDYAPGETAQITGSGFVPGEVVNLSIEEIPDLDADSPIQRRATADALGNISTTLPIDAADANIRFYLTAIGGNSGFTAGMTFTDSGPSLAFKTAPFVALPGSCSPPILIQASSENGETIGLSSTSGSGVFYSDAACTAVITSIVTSASGSSRATFYYKDSAGTPTITITDNGGPNQKTTGNQIGLNPASQTENISGTAAPTTMALVVNPTSLAYNVSQSVSLTATLTRTSTGAFLVGQPVDFIVNGVDLGTSNTNASGVATSSFNPTDAVTFGAALTAGPYTVTASYAGGTIASVLYAGSSKNQTFTVTGTAPAITSANNTTFTYGSAGTFDVTTTGTPASAISYTGTLPGGVSLVDNGNGTATLSGMPTASGDFAITITANNGVIPNATQNFTLHVNKANQAALTLNTTSPLTNNQSETLTVTGGSTGGAVTYNLVTGPCTVVGNQLTANSGTGACTLTATMAGNANYNDVTSTPANTVTLQKANQAALTLNTTSPLTYNQSETLSVTGGSTGGAVIYNLVTGPCTIVADQLTANSGTGTCTLTATMAGNANYNDVTSTPANTVTLQKANQAALTLNTTTPLTYNQSETLSVTGGSTGGAVTYNLVTGPCTVVGNQLTANSGTGACTLTATMAGNANYNDVTSTPANTVTLQKANQAALTLNTTTPLTYNQSETLTVTGGSTGGAVTYNLVTGPCTIVADQLTANSGTGTCTLTATMAGNANYNDVTSTPANTVTLQKANQAALTLNTTTPLTYNQSETLTIAGGSTGGAVTYNLVTGPCTVVGNQLTANSGTGSCTLTATMAGNANYNDVTSTPANTVTLQKANQMALTLNTTSPLTYNQSETLSVAGGSTGGAVTYSLVTGPCTVVGNQLTANSGTGTCTLTATMAGNANYNDVTSTPANTVTLQKATQAVVTVTGPTDITYGTTGTAMATGGSGTGGYSFTAGGSGGCSVSGTTVTVLNASLICTLTAIRAGDNNYLDSAPSAAFPVTLHKASSTTTLTGGGTFNYDGTAHAATVSVTGAGGLSLTPSPSYSGTCNAAPITVAQGTSCTASYTFAGDDNHTGSNGSAAITIIARAITVKPVGQSIFFGTSPAAFTYSVTVGSVISGDSLGTASYTFNGSSTVPTGVGIYTLAVTGLSNPNYMITFTTSTFTIQADTTMLVLSGPSSVMYGKCGAANYSAVLTNVIFGTPVSGQTITFTIGSHAPVTAVTDATGTANVILSLSDPVSPPNITATAIYAGNATMAPSTSNSLTITIAPGIVGPIPGQSIYTGPMLVWTGNSTSSTATATLSATIQDTSCAGDIRTAKVTFAIRNSNGSYTPIPSAQNLSVGLVSPTDPTTGTASAIVQLNTGSGAYAQYDIAVIVGGNYLVNDPTHDTLITVAQPGQANSMIGSGTVNLLAAPPAAGFLATPSGIEPGSDGYLQVAAAVQYNKSGTNPHGSVVLQFNSYNKPNGTVDSILHTYQITSNSIASLTQPKPGMLSFTAKCNVTDVTNPVAPIALDGGATMQVTTTNATSGNNGFVNIEVQPKAGGMWIAAGWNGTQPQPKPIISGGIAGQ